MSVEINKHSDFSYRIISSKQRLRSFIVSVAFYIVLADYPLPLIKSGANNIPEATSLQLARHIYCKMYGDALYTNF